MKEASAVEQTFKLLKEIETMLKQHELLDKGDYKHDMIHMSYLHAADDLRNAIAEHVGLLEDDE